MYRGGSGPREEHGRVRRWEEERDRYGGQHLAARRHGAAARAHKEGVMRRRTGDGERGEEQGTKGRHCRPGKAAGEGGSGEVDEARAALRLLKVVARDVILPGGLGRRGDLAVDPRRWDPGSTLVEAGARFTLSLYVTDRALPGAMGATTPVARERRRPYGECWADNVGGSWEADEGATAVWTGRSHQRGGRAGRRVAGGSRRGAQGCSEAGNRRGERHCRGESVVLLEEGRIKEVIIGIRCGGKQMHLVGGSVQRAVDDVFHDDAAKSRNLLSLAPGTSNKLGDRRAERRVDDGHPSFEEVFHEVL